MDFLSIRQIQERTRQGTLDATVHLQLTKNTEKKTRPGKIFHQLEFADAEGNIKLNVFEDNPPFASARQLQAPMFCELSGRWKQSSFGLECFENWNLRPLEQAEISKLLQGSETLRTKQAEDYATIQSLVGEMADPRLKALCQEFLSRHGELFQRTAAAREYHHARRGGLVEHVAQMMRSAAKLAEVYTTVNRDLVLAGVLFHDCGKLWENAYGEEDFQVPYQKIGELLGHITLGIELVNKLWTDLEKSNEPWKALKPASSSVRLHLIHLIGSHHGTHEFGSPVLPKTPEAVLLHFVDNIDAKMEMVLEGYGKGEPLGPGIVGRVRPLRHSLVTPLPVFQPGESPSPTPSPIPESESAAEPLPPLEPLPSDL